MNIDFEKMLKLLPTRGRTKPLQLFPSRKEVDKYGGAEGWRAELIGILGDSTEASLVRGADIFVQDPWPEAETPPVDISTDKARFRNYVERCLK